MKDTHLVLATVLLLSPTKILSPAESHRTTAKTLHVFKKQLYTFYTANFCRQIFCVPVKSTSCSASVVVTLQNILIDSLRLLINYQSHTCANNVKGDIGIKMLFV